MSVLQLAFQCISLANIRLPKLVGDHMVLQREVDIPIWGWADANEEVTITFNGKTYKTMPNADKKWQIFLPKIKAGGPYSMTIKGKNTIEISDILIGDVWLGSGQSNMEWLLKMDVDNYKKEISEANYPNIRLFDVKDELDVKPKTEINSMGWQLCNQSTIGDFSAVAYFFGRHIHKKYNIPVGLITADWGGTQIEAWMSADALKGFPEFAEKLIDENSAINLEEARKSFGQKMAVWQKKHTANDIGYQSKTGLFFDNNIDTKDWKKMILPHTWDEIDGLQEFDGVIWFRKDIEINKNDAGKPITLNLAQIDDIDSTWFNGKLIGGTSPWNATRKYIVPGNLVKEGINHITVRVLDMSGGGGIYGNPTELNMIVGNQNVSLANEWKYKIGLNTVGSPQAPNLIFGPNSLSALYNGMIAPIIPYPLKGIIWYQGEANVDRAYQYRELFPKMISDWRSKWGIDFPFLFVQLASFMPDKDEPSDYDWAELREAQMMTLSTPKTGMAVTTDIGNVTDIHPKNKQDVGKRLALAAENIAYGDTSVVFQGPFLSEMKMDGDKVHLKFDTKKSDLMLKDKYGYVRGFSIAGEDKKYYWATGKLVNNEIIIQSEKVKNPISVRYNWGNSPDGNIFNKNGLPAPPFRTDDWKGKTYGKK
jgi:sialate O-acetylesterase